MKLGLMGIAARSPDAPSGGSAERRGPAGRPWTWTGPCTPDSGRRGVGLAHTCASSNPPPSGPYTTQAACQVRKALAET